MPSLIFANRATLGQDIILSVAVLNVTVLNVAVLNVPVLNVAVLNVTVLNAAVLNVAALNVALLNVATDITANIRLGYCDLPWINTLAYLLKC